MALESLPKIAPALFSAEQDLIQIYNKKSDTTGVINPSYIKSSPSGVAGAIQFSDGSAFASDASNLFWDDANNRLGVGTNSPLDTIDAKGVIRVSRTDAANYYLTLSAEGGFGRISSYGGIGLHLNETTNTVLKIQSGDVTIGNNITMLPARLGIKGSGSTSATTSLLVQNSSGTTSLQVTDDRTTFVNGLLNVGTIYSGIECNNLYSAIFQNGGSGGQIRLSMGGTNYLQVNQPKDANSGVISGTINTIITPISYGWSSGTASPNLLSLNPSINNTGTYSGTFRGIYYNPTLTSLTGTTHIAFENTTGDVLFGTTSGNVGIGTNTPIYKADIGGTLRVTDGSFALTYVGNAQNGSLVNAGTYPSFKVTNAAGVTRGILGSGGPHGYLDLQENGTTYTYLTGTATGNAGYSYFLSQLGVGTATTLGAKLSIKGSGSTSATTSLLVQNSAGNEMFRLRDDQYQTFTGYGAYFNHPTYNGSLRIENIGNYQQQIRGAYGENIQFGTGGNTISINATEVYWSNSLYGSAASILTNGVGTFGSQYASSASAQLEVISTTKGFLPPRMTDAQIRAIVAPANGLVAYNTDINHLCCYQNGAWAKFSHSPM